MKLFVAVVALVGLTTSHTAFAAFPSTVSSLMDTSVDPCDDFYQYSCGAWVKNTVLADDETSRDYSFTTVADRNEVVIQAIVGEDWPLIGELWDSCMDVDTLNALGNKPLKQTLNKINAVSTKQDLFKVVGEIAKTGPKLFTTAEVYPDQYDATTNYLWVWEGDLTLTYASYYLDESNWGFLEPYYREYISSVVTLAGMTSSNQQQQQGGATSTKAQEDAVIKVEQTLAALLDYQDGYYNLITIGEAQAKFPLTFGQFSEGYGLLENSAATEETTVIFESFDYFANVEAAVAKLSLAELKTFVAFSYASYNARFLSADFYQTWFNLFGAVLQGQVTPSSRSSICTSRETTYFPDLIGKYYFAKMFTTESEEATELMVDLVEEAMKEHIEKLDWLDDATRAKAEEKLAKVSNLIGRSYQKRSLPYYLDRTTFFDNLQKINLDNYKFALNALTKPVDKTQWEMGAAEVNAYYQPSKNQMVFPAGILQPPFFNGTSHPAQNFGSIGAVVGHELTHGFDSNGRYYDGDGNVANWWTEETSEAFDERAQCLAEEYSNFQMIGEDGTTIIGNVDGNLTITENIADNGGLGLAFDAFHNYLSSDSAEIPKDTPVKDDEVDKLFFVAFAQTFCGKARDAAVKQQLTDVHSPGQWRINGATMNNANFAKTFNCPAGSKMNPEKKCVLW